MKQRNTSLIVLCFALLLGLSSCSKDKKISKQLQKDGGVWDISTLVYKNVETWPSGQLTVEATAVNPGKFTFRDGVGDYTYSDLGVTRSGTFVYTVDNEEINIVYELQNTTGSGYQNSGVYIGTQKSKNLCSLVGSEIYEDSASQTVFTGEFTLIR